MAPMDGEPLELVDEAGRALGTVTRREAHGDPRLIHRVVHVLVVNRRGEILLQRRSLSRSTAPGRWDTSVGGHCAPGEGAEEAARRELREELGIDAPIAPCHEWLYRNGRESEYVHAFLLRHEGPFRPDPGEIDEVRFWSPGEIEAALGGGLFSGQFEGEYDRYRRRARGREDTGSRPGRVDREEGIG